MNGLLKLVNSAQMSVIDAETIEHGAATGLELMERAGRGVVDAIAEQWQGLEGLSSVVICGKGNNGGDGFVVGRLLREGDSSVRVFLAADRARVKGDAAEHLRRFEQTGGEIETISSDLGQLAQSIEEADLVVDAMIGTGTRGGARGLTAAVIDCVLESGRSVVAVDLPSGLDADSGSIEGPCIKASLTVTFGLPKIGQLFQPGRAQCGRLQLVDIGLSEVAIENSVAQTYLLTQDAARRLVPSRPDDAHKGTCGLVAVVAGSVGMTGAAALAADAAMLSGAGKVTLGVPASLNDILEVKLTEVMTRPLPEVRRSRCLSLRALGQILEFATDAECVALGPGLGQHTETTELVRRLLTRIDRSIVIDADGINALAGREEILAEVGDCVLTPHLGEFARLTRLSIEEIQAGRVELSREFAVRTHSTLVLKGAPTLIASSDGRVVVNPTGNAGMATAGSGDVLTGLVAGFVAQGLSGFEAAMLGAFVHGRAGDVARDRLGEWSVRARDIRDALPEAILAVLKGS